MPITTLDGTRRLLLSPASLCLSVSLLPLLPLSGRFIGSSVHRSRLRILLSNYTVTCNRSCQLAALFFLPECNPFFREGPRGGFRFDSSFLSPSLAFSLSFLRVIPERQRGGFVILLVRQRFFLGGNSTEEFTKERTWLNKNQSKA